MLIAVENAMIYAVCSGIERDDVGNPDNVAVVRNVMVGVDSGIGINVGINVVAGVGINVGVTVGVCVDRDNDTEYCFTLTEPTMEIY